MVEGVFAEGALGAGVDGDVEEADLLDAAFVAEAEVDAMGAGGYMWL